MLQKSLSLSAVGLALAMVTGSTLPVGAFNQMVVLGDSLSDQGNFLPLTGGMFPNSPYFSAGRFSNGEVWTGYLAEELGLSSNIINYAFGGATTGSGSVSPIPGALGLKQQIDAFQLGTNVRGQPITLADDPLYLLWAGTNDYLLTNGEANKTKSQKVIVSNTIANLSSALEVLAGAGAHDIVVPNLGDLTLIPLVAGTNSQNKKNLRDLVELHNKSLDKALKKLSKSFPTTNFISFNSYDFFNQILANPLDYGLTNIAQACTKTNLYDPINPFPAPNDIYNQGCNESVQNTYFFWDSVHPTTHVHELIADSVLALLTPASTKHSLTRAANTISALLTAPVPLDETVSVPEPTSPFSLLALGAGSVALMTLKRRRH